jgi:hypothetical protein
MNNEKAIVKPSSGDTSLPIGHSRLGPFVFVATMSAALLTSVVGAVYDKPAISLVGVTAALFGLAMLCAIIVDALNIQVDVLRASNGGAAHVATGKEPNEPQ